MTPADGASLIVLWTPELNTTGLWCQIQTLAPWWQRLVPLRVPLFRPPRRSPMDAGAQGAISGGEKGHEAPWWRVRTPEDCRRNTI
jgi:hypothetical protein